MHGSGLFKLGAVNSFDEWTPQIIELMHSDVV